MAVSDLVDLYVRVSRIGSREHTITEDEQERDGRKFALARGKRVSEVIADIDRSGGTLERPGLQRVLERVEAGLTSGVVVAYLSRLSRDTTQGLELLNRIQAAGGTVYAPNLPDYTTADGKMLTTIQLAVDAGYRERKREELERAKERAIEAGIPVSNRSPTGYRKRADRRLEPDPRVAPVVRRVFELRADGAGPTELARQLEAHAVTTSQGSRTWTKSAVMSVIHNRAYLGELSYGRRGDGEPRFINPTAHPAIVTPELWRRAQSPSVPRPAPQRSEQRVFMLTGVARCAICGYSLNATTTSRGHRIYRCAGRHSGGTHTSWSVQADVIEPAINTLFWDHLEDVSAVGRPVAADADSHEALTQALEHAEAQYAQIKTTEGQDAFGGDYFAMVRERRLTVEVAEEQLARAQATREQAVSQEHVVTLRKLWETLTLDERRELVAARFDLIGLRRDGNVVTYAAWPTGTAPDGLSRRGFRKGAGFRPLDLPDTARLLALQDPHQLGRKSGVGDGANRSSKPGRRHTPLTDHPRRRGSAD
jgi:DNA invertase Pin-like site-specific DNA recombinase